MPAPMTGRAQTTPKKSRPAALDIQQVHDKPLLLVPTGGPSATAVVDAATPDELQLSSPSELNSSAENSPLDSSVFFDAVDGGDELSAELAELRRKVKTNLRLRPLRSSQSLAALAREQAGTGPLPDSHASDEIPDGDAWQPGSSPSTASSAPSEPPEPDHQQGVPPSPMSSVIDSARSSLYFTPTSAGPMSSFAHDTPHSAHFIGSAKIDYSTYHTPRTPSPRPSRALHPHEVALRCDGFSRPLIIDTRPVPAYLERRIRGSINVAIPTLILKRSKKSGGFATIDIIRQYITTEDGKQIWDDLMGSNGPWDGDVIVYDEDMDERQRDNAQSTAWALLPLLQKHLTHGGIDWIQGGFGACTTHSPIHNLLVSGESEGDNAHQDDNVVSLKVPSAQPSPRPGSQPGSQPGSGRRPGGLFQLNTQAAAARGRSLAVVEPDSTTSLHPPSPGPFRNSSEPPPRSPAPMMNALMPPARGEDPSVSSPAPSQTGFLRPRPPTKKPSLPQLSKLDTRSAERLPKLTLRPVPSKSLSLSMPTISANSSPVVAPPSFSLTRPPRSPSHLALAHSNHMSPPPSAISPQGGWNLNSFGSRSAEHLPPPTPSFRSGFGGHSGPSSPRTPNGRSEPPSPLTARPTPDTSHPLTSDTEEAYPEFAVSTILPNFLYLGPEMTTDEHVDELENLGVRRILNLAFECDDDQGLHLRERFEKYIRIPMRDTVEEDNITMGVKKACEALDDARLHSAPTYVHCKAGKSRSVTAVMAYLIHANRWTLSQSYQFVLERRKGISPNIGFVSELMGFEQQELGSKSMGVVKGGAGPGSHGHANDPHGENGPQSAGHPSQAGQYGVAAGSRRPSHARESLPPMPRGESESLLEGAYIMPGEGALSELEIRDGENRYRHFRRPPVDERIMPIRRVSKAGLESWDE